MYNLWGAKQIILHRIPITDDGSKKCTYLDIKKIQGS